MAVLPAGFAWLKNSSNNPLKFAFMQQGWGGVIDNSVQRAGTDEAIPCICLCIWYAPTQMCVAHIASNVESSQVELPTVQTLTSNTITNLLAGWEVDLAFNKTYFCCGGFNLANFKALSQAIVAGINAALTNNNISARQPWLETPVLRDATGFIMPLNAVERALNPALVLSTNNLPNMGWIADPIINHGDMWKLYVRDNDKMQPYWGLP